QILPLGDRFAGFLIDELLTQPIAGGLVDLPEADALCARAGGVPRGDRRDRGRGGNVPGRKKKSLSDWSLQKSGNSNREVHRLSRFRNHQTACSCLAQDLQQTNLFSFVM
ncbi:MAG: hypothetical protein WB500_07325, partial [Rhodoplanes sp.]